MKRIRFFIIYTGLVLACSSVSAQSDSISLNSILKQVISNYPSMRKVQQDINSANARVAYAKTGYLPEVGINSNYTHLGPSSSITFPGFGSFELYPTENYSASLDYRQTIYDFGKTSKSVDLEKENRDLVNITSSQIKQKLSSGVVSIYYAIVYLQEAVKIKDEELRTLKEHLSFVEKKKITGSATQYEVLTTQVRISTTENQKTDLLNALKVQVCQLNSFLGQPEKTTLLVKKELQSIQGISSTDSLLNQALKARPEMKFAQQKIAVSEMKYKTVGNQNNPVFSFNASGGIKDGYDPDLYKGIWNYTVGVGLKIPLFDANKVKYTKVQVKADIESNKEDLELTRRNIVNEVVEEQANLQSSLEKIQQSELQHKQAKEAYGLAETSFKSGVITNLELLDSSTSLSEADLSLLKSKIDYSLNLLKLKIALGQDIY
jgi:outer membrane protein